MKKRPEDLALLGGGREFDSPLHVGSPSGIDVEACMGRIRRVFTSNRLTNDGPLVRELEERCASFLGVRHCVAVSSGTSGLEVAVRALGLSGEVIVPSFTFVATAHVLQWLGIRPVFCDIDPLTHTIDPAKAADLVSPETTGIIGVHLWGTVCDTAGLEELAAGHGLSLVFDAAHAFGSSRGGRPAGGFGSAEVFSLHATKLLSSAEGGLVTTDDDGLAAGLRLMRNFGFAGYDNVVSVGINAKMSELEAAAGLTALDGVEGLLEHSRANYLAYRRCLEGMRGLRLHPLDTGSNNCQYVVTEVDPLLTGIGRDDILRILWEENVLARRYFYPGCHRSEPYATLDPAAGERLPVTEALCESVLCLPSGSAVDRDTIERVCQLLGFVADNGPSISERLAGNS